MKLLRWSRDGVDYVWDGLFLTSVDADGQCRTAAGSQQFGRFLWRLADPSPLCEFDVDSLGPRDATLASIAEGHLRDCDGISRRSALLIRRAGEASGRIQEDVRALCADGRLEDAEKLAIAAESLAVDREGVQP